GNTQDHRISSARIDELRVNLQLFDLGKTRFRYMIGRPLIPFKLRTRLSLLLRTGNSQLLREARAFPR
ncbi:hypothetical protein, partial [Rhizobium brockwellii]|uniref:hypothetical protein n=1 Tax=Rhizobium brockwellii TaxID=3019932 RepID=UPI003F9B8172